MHHTKTTPKKHYKPKQSKDSNRLINLINTINNNRKDIAKMHNNLPAKLMQLNNPTSLSQPHNNHHQQPQMHSSSYAKSISSTFSSVMHNGHTHSQGKRIINESDKPYLEVEEMNNGTTQHYMIPKNTIAYKPITFNHKNNSKTKTLVHSSKPKKNKSHTKSHTKHHTRKQTKMPLLKN